MKILNRCPIASLLIAAISAAAPISTDPNNQTGSNGLILIDKLGHYIRFFDPATFTEVSSLELPVNPHDLAISGDHSTAYVPIYGDGVYGNNPHPGHQIAIIDLKSRKLAGMIDVSPHQAPHGVQVDSRGLIYVTCDLSRKLLVIDPKTQKIVDAIDTDGTGHWVVMLPDGSKAYVPNKDDRKFVGVIDLKSRRLVARVPAPNGSQGIAESPDGKQIAVVDFTDPVVLIVDYQYRHGRRPYPA